MLQVRAAFLHDTKNNEKKIILKQKHTLLELFLRLLLQLEQSTLNYGFFY